MKKLWSYLAVGLAFFSAGLIVMKKTIGEQISVTVKKQRIWGRGNTMVLDVTPDIETPENRKKPRIDRKFERKQGRILRRNARRTRKALEKFD